MHKKLCVVALGARDYYQVPIALLHAKRLAFLITDLYLPDVLRPYFDRRFNVELPSKRTKSIFWIFVVAILVRKPPFRGFRRLVDYWFGYVAASICRRIDADAIVYSYYAEGFSEYCRRSGWKPEKLFVFQVHPSPWKINSILRADAEVARQQLGVEFQSDIEEDYSEKDIVAYQSALSESTSIIAASSFTVDSIRNVDAERNLKTVVAPYGSKFEHGVVLTRPRLGLEQARHAVSFIEGKKKFLTVAQLSQRKGLHWAFAALPTQYANQIDWIVVSSKIDPEIQRLAPSCVRFVGRLDHAALGHLFETADCFVLPSLVEGFGLVYIEALSFGTPLVYTRNTGIPDIAANRDIGVQLDIERLQEGFSDFVMDILNDPSWKAKRTHACSQVASDNTWSQFRRVIVESID